MKLLQPDPGEILDRITILAYKRNRPEAKVEGELERLLAGTTPSGRDFVSYNLLDLLELAHVNGQLWALTDVAVHHEDTVDYTVVVALNSRRAALIRKLTEEVLGSSVPNEKDY